MSAPSATSLIDAVDARNEPIGTVARGDALRSGVNFRTVHVLVFSATDDLLLQRLSADRERNPLAWGSSVAGYLHAGEDYASAAERRIVEELGVAPALTLLGVTAMEDAGVTKFVGVYTAHADTPGNADPGQIAELRFWSLSDVEAEIGRCPQAFTGTLRHVLEFWRGQNSLR